MEGTENRAARDIVASMGDKALFTYIPEMEITVPESDRRNSMDKIACYYHAEQFVLSDLYIGYAISLYRYTIPMVVAATVKVLGNLWPQKNVPKNIDRDALLSRIKRMCGMGMLRRFVYQLNGNNIVLYSTTPEFSKVIYQSLKMSTDARPEKDLIPPIEIIGRAAASLVSSQLLKSPYLKTFDFMPDFRDGEGRIVFNSMLTHVIDEQEYITLIEPLFTRVDIKRFTKEEWNHYLSRKIHGLRGYMEQLAEKKMCRVQLVIVCEDMEDFREISTMICNVFPEQMLEEIYYTAEGSLKSADYNIRQSLVRVTSLKTGQSDIKIPGSVSSQLSYPFF
ncbi:MAG: hypothetical protein PHW34_09225 [Hespellia sp.]|nr:hypothetical protein [Hespellia sp.]